MTMFRNRKRRETPVPDTTMYELAEQLVEGETFQPLDYAKAVWLGSPDPDERRAGRHPWPTREHDGERFVYSVPVAAGISAVRGTALFIGHDPWRHERDPRSWLVAEANLKTGEEIDHRVLSSYVGSAPARQLWLQLAPANYSNIPEWKDRYDANGWLAARADKAYHPPRYDQLRIEGNLKPDYYLDKAILAEGLGGKRSEFEDLVVLESMMWAVQHLREQRMFELRRQAVDRELGREAAAFSGVHAA